MTKFKNNYLSNINGKYNKEIINDFYRNQIYFSLYILKKEENCSLNYELKKKFIRLFEKKHKKKYRLLKNIFIKKPFNFGNHIAAFNNIIYYSEILGIKNIFLNSEYNWYIKNDIKTDKIQITLLPNKEINCNSPEILCGDLYSSFYFPILIKPERRSLIFKEEFKKNLPKIKINKNDLYIYIRGGDSFNINGCEYSPSPYCFYNKVISDFKFKNIFIISKDNKNPIIEKLLLEHPNIKYKMKTVEQDIAILMNVFNLVNSVSSFTQAAISFNDNLLNLFEYEIYKIGARILHYHYDIDKLNRKFNIYRMKPSEEYIKKMFKWENMDMQRKLLFKENCKYDFKKSKYTKTFIE